jgi:hypothetical protein
MSGYESDYGTSGGGGLFTYGPGGSNNFVQQNGNISLETYTLVELMDHQRGDGLRGSSGRGG